MWRRWGSPSWSVPHFLGGLLRVLLLDHTVHTAELHYLSYSVVFVSMWRVSRVGISYGHTEQIFLNLPVLY